MFPAKAQGPQSRKLRAEGRGCQDDGSVADVTEVFLAYAFRASPGVLVIEGTRVIITVIVVSRSAGCRQAGRFGICHTKVPIRQVSVHNRSSGPRRSPREQRLAGTGQRLFQVAAQWESAPWRWFFSGFSNHHKFRPRRNRSYRQKHVVPLACAGQWVRRGGSGHTCCAAGYDMLFRLSGE